MVGVEKKGINLLQHWSKASYQYPYSVFSGTYLSSSTDIPCYSFSTNKEVIKFIQEKTRDAENSVREECNIPRVNEGWVSETNLFYELCQALPDLNIIHHARPSWLGRQHLDILIDEFYVALEFQGEQHDKPVGYFGGEEAFKTTQRRDDKKKRLCKKNGIRLIYIHHGYNLHEIIEQIKNQTD